MARANLRIEAVLRVVAIGEAAVEAKIAVAVVGERRRAGDGENAGVIVERVGVAARLARRRGIAPPGIVGGSLIDAAIVAVCEFPITVLNSSPGRLRCLELSKLSSRSCPQSYFRRGS